MHKLKNHRNELLDIYKGAKYNWLVTHMHASLFLGRVRSFLLIHSQVLCTTVKKNGRFRNFAGSFKSNLGWVSNFNRSINWHHHMKDQVEISHLTKLKINLETGSKSTQTSQMLRQRSQKPYKLLFIYYLYFMILWYSEQTYVIFISASFKW